MRWAAAADAGFGLPEGFFIGPYGRGGTRGDGHLQAAHLGAAGRVSTRRGDQPAIGDEQRRQAARDADFWGASCVALADDAPHAESLRATLEQLYGPATRVADAWTWQV